MLRADGYKIVNTLVTDLVPDRNVLRAMNDIETKKRERDAAQQAAEAKKVMVVMAAEAEKEARKLNGEGIADQRKAIVEGLKESVCQFVRCTSPPCRAEAASWRLCPEALAAPWRWRLAALIPEAVLLWCCAERRRGGHDPRGRVSSATVCLRHLATVA